MSQVQDLRSQTEPCTTPEPGRFYAYATDEGPCAGHKVPGAESFTDAAIGFLECWGPSEDASGDEVSVTVIDCETGEQVCYKVAIDMGAMRPC
ncbi:MAG: hypothetical protein JHD15_03375 [Phenylobacterium sp.]|uniref:DUF5961 family protein n=1 Tax=Phenylobacterium sp. TaxID=1871053 RepID=UPI001A32FF4E|nr:DUF5961 family protein [Phenylobacterium sp.]MBJ7409391.1 hypothetical protein [Phenylobacterium sp.]